MRVAVIVNPRASSVTPRALAEVAHTLDAGLDVTIHHTRASGHAAELARTAAADGVDAVVVYAGDGTLNEAANGLAGLATPLAPLPGGSTNVFARAIGYPMQSAPAARVLLDSLLAGRAERLGVGLVNGRRFLFNCGIGFDAAVVARAEQRAKLKRWAAHAWYAATAVSTWWRHYDHDLRFAIRTGREDGHGGEEVRPCAFAIVSRLSPYTYFGRWPLVVTHDAGLDRGLAVVGFERLELGLLVRAAGSALRGGRLLHEHPAIHHWHDLDEVVVDGPDGVPHQVDGEYLGEATRLHFRYESEALTVVLPVDGSGAPHARRHALSSRLTPRDHRGHEPR